MPQRRLPGSALAIVAGLGVALLLSLQSPSQARDQRIVRGPIISMPKPGLVQIRVHSAKKGTVECTLTPLKKHPAQSQKSVNKDQHLFAFKLPDGVKFKVQLSLDGQDETPFESQSRAKKDQAFRFAVLGDSGSGSDDQRRVAAIMEQQRPDFVLHTGDIVYPMGEAEQQDPKFFKPYASLLKRAPFFVSLGNHDMMTKRAQPALEAHDLPHNNPEKTERYYSFNWGNAHFIALDSNEILLKHNFSETKQGRWLQADLAANKQRWTFVFFHHPPYSCMLKRLFPELIVRRRVAKVLEQAGVDVVFNGHDHLYHRSKPIKNEKLIEDIKKDQPNAKPGAGTVYVVTGGGGRSLYKGTKRHKTAALVLSHNVVIVDINGSSLKATVLAPLKTPNKTPNKKLGKDAKRSKVIDSFSWKK